MMNRLLPVIIFLTVAFLVMGSLNSIGLKDNYSMAERDIYGQTQVNKNSSSLMNSNATDFLDYGNSTLGIRMFYPSNWTIEHFGSNVSFVPPQGFESFVLSVVPLPVHLDLLGMVNAHLRELNLYREGPMGREGILIELTPTLISDGQDAYRIAYLDVCMPDLMTCNYLNVWAVHGDKVYKMQHSIMGDLDPTVEKMIDSFKFVD